MTRTRKLGFILNLTHKKPVFTALNQHLVGFNHVSRTVGEYQVALLSKRELEMVSYPINDGAKTLLMEFNKAVSCQSNMIGHIEIAKEEVEITSGLAGANGNLIWVNTGGAVIRLKLKTGKEVKSVLLHPALAFVS